MPWHSKDILLITEKGRNLIHAGFGIRPNSNIFVCTEQEIYQATLNELISNQYPEYKIEFLKKYYLPDIIGKYFAQTNEIWLVDGKGTNLPSVIHELIHSIQKCFPHREDIVEYLTYKILNGDSPIERSILTEWDEIESEHGLSIIKKQILLDSDCEDF